MSFTAFLNKFLLLERGLLGYVRTYVGDVLKISSMEIFHYINFILPNISAADCYVRSTTDKGSSYTGGETFGEMKFIGLEISIEPIHNLLTYVCTYVYIPNTYVHYWFVLIYLQLAFTVHYNNMYVRTRVYVRTYLYVYVCTCTSCMNARVYVRTRKQSSGQYK